jgi:transcriptional regulator with XRE-family HTH domain
MPPTPTFSHPRLGSVLRALRERASLTQREVCERVVARGGHLGVTWLSRLERGLEAPSRQLLDLILTALGSSRAELESLLERPASAPSTAPEAMSALSVHRLSSGGPDRSHRAFFSAPTSSLSATSHCVDSGSTWMAPESASVSMSSLAPDERALVHSFRSATDEGRRLLLSNASYVGSKSSSSGQS